MLKNLKDILGKNHRFNKNSKSTDTATSHKADPIHSFNFLELIEKWEQIIGPLVFKHTRPLKLNKKRLVIVSDHPAFSHQLTFLKDEILRKIAKEFPQLKGVRDIYFETNVELFIGQTKLVRSPLKAKEELCIHPLSPEYRALKERAIKEVREHYGESEFEDIFVEIYLQILLRKELK